MRLRLPDLWVKITLLFTVAILTLSCEKEGELTRLPPGKNLQVGNNATVLKTGSLSGRNAHSCSGTVEVLQEDGQYKVRLRNVQTDNAPDLRVYLSQAESPSSILNLGAFSYNQDELIYAVPGNVDPTGYPYLIIYCQAFTVTVGVAPLS